jgi:hypothetical protein
MTRIANIESQLNYAGQGNVVISKADVRYLLDREQVLRLALADALEGMQDMLPYVPDYFQKKWCHQDYIDRARAALSEETAP